ncbi:MAG: aminodeoxychorismate/anthranilate synthase component II [Anaerolineae bacterium]|nr:aminodeoxychorismate/anthranilate synthase component II [Anaerolineae bacterium]
MIVVIDNYDSFTYNLVQLFGELGAEICVFRNDMVSVRQIADLSPGQIVISPGPGTPDDTGVSLDVLRDLSPTIPTLGVCLGHQSIGQVFGGVVKRAPQLMHGKTSLIYHQGEGILAGMARPFEATRYHSLIVEENTLPDCLHITARTIDGEIMGLQHKELPIYGVQFHPESILTADGRRLLRNFVELREQIPA